MVVALAAVCTSCASSPAARPSASPSATVSPEPQPSPTPTAEATPAEAAVAAMSLRERAASVVMGYIPTTDAAALHAYMESSGAGGFLLMGANIPGDEAALQALTAALTVDPARPPLVAIDQEGG